MRLLSSMTFFSRAFGCLARWDRPSDSVSSSSSDHPGLLLVGPDENLGLAGFTEGLLMLMMVLLMPYLLPRKTGQFADLR
jgi:hypothetical protein